MKTTYFFILALAVNLSLTNCTRTEWVAAVGKQRISKADAEKRQKMMSYFDDSMNLKKASEQLVAYEVRNHILSSKGVELSEQELKDFLNKQKNEAKKNQKLAQFLQAFEKDPQFENLYVRPQLVDQKTGELYEKDNAFNQAELAKAQGLLAKAQQDPSQFEALSKEMSLPFLKVAANNKDSQIEWEAGRELASTSGVPMDRPWFIQMIKNGLLSKAPAGKMVPELKPMWFGYMIVRHDGSSKDQFKFSLAVAPRKNRGMWEKQNSFTLNVTRFPAMADQKVKK